MKVLWICGLPSAVQVEALQGRDCGAESSWSWIVAHLPPPPGIDLHIACRVARWCEPAEFSFRGATFHLVPVKSVGRVYCLFKFDVNYFRPLVQRLQPEVIHGWGTEDGYARAALELAPARHVVQVQGIVTLCRRRAPMIWHTWFAALNERLVLRRARHVLAENEFSRDAVRPLLGKAVAETIEHPIREEFLAAAPSDGRGKRMLYLGVIEERKGIWDALEAFSQGAEREWHLVVIGEGPARELARFQKRITQPDLGDRVTHHSGIKVQAIVREMQSASVLLLPTKVDTGPTSLKEALVMGLWPVCYDNTGPGHYLRKFGVGTLVPDGDVGALTKAVREVTGRPDANPMHADTLVQARMRSWFNPARIWPQLADFYRRLP